MYESRQLSNAEYNSWVHLPESSLSGITQGADAQELVNRKYAQMTYQVNASPISISGDVIVDAVGLDGSGDVKLSGDQLKVSDQTAIDNLIELNINQNYSRIIQERSTDIYIGHAPIGTSEATSGWRIQKLDLYGSRSWADTGQFIQPANIELSALVYSY